MLVAICGLLAVAPAAHAAKSCGEPGAAWQRATPAEAGMDAAKLQDAIDYGSSQEGFALRVYRRGCLVGQDRAAAVNGPTQFESWSMAKSVVSLMFGRAMTLGLISPDDPVGSLVPEADAAHGTITIRDLLTMASGLRWNGIRDYNIFTMPDRVRDALTLDIAHPHGTYFEYAQSAIALLAEAVGRATGEDVQAFGQRELLDPLGIPASAWRWERDPAGHVQGFTGVNMRPDDYGRLGELMRRGGVWNGRRLLSQRYVREAVTPSATNGCYGWLIWLNAGSPCISPTITERGVEDTREFPDLPADLLRFSGLFGQLVSVFPSQDLVIVRLGEDSGLVFSGGTNWEHELYRRVLTSITDQKIVAPAPTPPSASDQKTNKDYGFQTALTEPDQYSKGVDQDPLPPAGPQRARAARLRLAHPSASRKGVVTIRMTCPARWPGRDPGRCTGSSHLEGVGRELAYDVAPGATTILRFRMSARQLRSLHRHGAKQITVVATNADAGGGAPAAITVNVRRPRA